MGLDKSQVRYWIKKRNNPNFHNKQLGGDKRSIFVKEELPIVHQQIIKFLAQNKTADAHDLCHFLSEKFSRSLSLSTCCNLVKKLGWSWRIPNRFQIHKYTVANISYYSSFLTTLQEIPMERIKFVDECHIVSKDLVNKKVLGLVGKRSFTSERTLREPSASLTLLTSLSNEVPIFFDYRIESNNQRNFADFVYYACKFGYLQNGDYLI